MKMTSRCKGRGKDNGPDRVSEYILTYKRNKYRKFNLLLLQNLSMCEMRTLQL